MQLISSKTSIFFGQIFTVFTSYQGDTLWARHSLLYHHRKGQKEYTEKMFIGQTHHKVYIFTSVAGEHLLNSLCLSSHSLLMTVTVNRTRVLLSLWMMLLASVTVIQMFISGSSISWYTLFFSVNLHKTEIREML